MDGHEDLIDGFFEKTKEMIKERITNYGGHATEICVQKMFGK